MDDDEARFTFQSKLDKKIREAIPHATEIPVHVCLPGLFVRKYDPKDTPETEITRLKAQVDRLERLVEDLQSDAEHARLLDQVKEMTQPQKVLAAFHQLSNAPGSTLRIIEILGIKLRNHGFLEQAIQLFSMARSSHRPDAVILRELGFCHRKLGPEHFAEATECFAAALEIRPFDSELRGMIGGMYKRQKQYDKSLEQYREANSIFPNDLYILVNLGAVSAILNKEDEARQHYQNVLRVCQDKITARTADHWTHICCGEASVYLGDEPGATLRHNTI